MNACATYDWENDMQVSPYKMRCYTTMFPVIPWVRAYTMDDYKGNVVCRYISGYALGTITLCRALCGCVRVCCGIRTLPQTDSISGCDTKYIKLVCYYGCWSCWLRKKIRARWGASEDALWCSSLNYFYLYRWDNLIKVWRGKVHDIITLLLAKTNIMLVYLKQA